MRNNPSFRLRHTLGAFAVLSAVTLSTAKCGIILHPERAGRTSGHISAVTLVLDCLLLLVGVVPGVVALIVDFSTGGIYGGGGKTAHAGQSIDLQWRSATPVSADLEFTLTAPNGAERALGGHHVGVAEQGITAGVSLPEDLEAGSYALTISVNGRKSATVPLHVR
jgi:hypothetical protein